MMLQKDQKSRPSAAEILNMEMVQAKLRKILEAKKDMGSTQRKRTLFKKRTPTIVLSTRGGSGEEVAFAQMTPKEKMQYRKEQARKEQEQAAFQAARNAKANYQFAKEAKQRELFEQVMDGENQEKIMTGDDISLGAMTISIAGKDMNQHGKPPKRKAKPAQSKSKT